jgi:hypothetical protein
MAAIVHILRVSFNLGLLGTMSTLWCRSFKIAWRKFSLVEYVIEIKTLTNIKNITAFYY